MKSDQQPKKATEGYLDNLMIFVWVALLLVGAAVLLDGVFAKHLPGYHGEVRIAIGAAVLFACDFVYWQRR